jgi:hypothetical protein
MASDRSQQRKLVAELDADGRGAAHAKYLLAGLELLQSALRDSREWLLKQLKAKHDGPPSRRPGPSSPDPKLDRPCFIVRDANGPHGGFKHQR